MARDNNTFAKRQREMQKKQKAMAKQTRRQNRKESAGGRSEPSSEGRPASEQ